MDFFLRAIAVAATLLAVVVSGVVLAGKKRYHPVAGTILNQLLNFGRLHDYMTHLASNYRFTYRLIAPFRSEVYTSDPANVEYILKTNFHNYAKGWYNYNILKDLLGDGIFTVDGQKWRDQRKVSSHEFSARSLRDISTIVFHQNAAKLANIVSQAALSNQSMDIQVSILLTTRSVRPTLGAEYTWLSDENVWSDLPGVLYTRSRDLFMKTALDSIFRVAFGFDLDSLSGSNEEGARFSRAFDDASEITAWRYVDVLWKIKKALNVGMEAKLKEHIRVIDEFVYKLIRSKTQQMQIWQDDSVNMKEDILSRFLKLSDADPKYLRDIVLNFVMAGKDTTATTLSWFFYMMCKHPLLQETTVQDVIRATDSNGVGDIAGFAGSLSEEALEKMHYLHAALTETLRLYPPVPVNPKMCMSDDTMPDGFHVKKGDAVAYQPYAMGRMSFIWGDDAEEFRPERWLDAGGNFRPESPFKFTAFQAGPRICLGKEFAYRQMKIVSAVLLRFFVFRLTDERKEVKYRTMINLHVDGGLHVGASCRLISICSDLG